MDKKEECIRLRKSGKSVKEVMSILGISNSTVYLYTKGEDIIPVHVLKSIEVKKEIESLVKEGYGNKYIADKLECTCSWVSNIRRKMDGYVGKPGLSTSTKPVTKVKRQPKSTIDNKMQKGLAKLKKGEKVFEKRLEVGRPINILYSDIGNVPIVKATIFSKHGGSDYDAVAHWAKKYNKKSFALLS